ncbi:MAG: uroporphyrinogen-III C-methyltransferase, partial [Thioalkalispiraceae bacterium]
MSEETDNNKPDASQAGSGQDSEADKSAKPDKQKTPESAPGKSAIEKSKAQASSSDKQKAQAKHATTQHKRHSPTHKSSGWGLVVIVVLGLLAVAGWYGLTEVQQTQQTFSELQQSQQALTSQNRDFEAAMSARMERLQAQQKELTDYIQVLRDKNQHLRKDWLLMEAEYLIQLANYRLLFERDINTAIAALDSADTRLRETGDPGVLAVRQVIAEA